MNAFIQQGSGDLSKANSPQGLLAVPFVLNSQPAVEYDDTHAQSLDTMARSARQRYAEIFRDVEDLILDHSRYPLRLGNMQIDRSSQPSELLQPPVETQHAGPDHFRLLHASRPGRFIQISGFDPRHLIPAVCCSVFQRHPIDPQHGPDHGHDTTQALPVPEGQAGAWA